MMELKVPRPFNGEIIVRIIPESGVVLIYGNVDSVRVLGKIVAGEHSDPRLRSASVQDTNEDDLIHVDVELDRSRQLIEVKMVRSRDPDCYVQPPRMQASFPLTSVSGPRDQFVIQASSSDGKELHTLHRGPTVIAQKAEKPQAV